MATVGWRGTQTPLARARWRATAAGNDGPNNRPLWQLLGGRHQRTYPGQTNAQQPGRTPAHCAI
eukprot:9815523-Lingulodinium_polyedra.AAC.1